VHRKKKTNMRARFFMENGALARAQARRRLKRRGRRSPSAGAACPRAPMPDTPIARQCERAGGAWDFSDCGARLGSAVIFSMRRQIRAHKKTAAQSGRFFCAHKRRFGRLAGKTAGKGLHRQTGAAVTAAIAKNLAATTGGFAGAKTALTGAAQLGWTIGRLHDDSRS